ncbi:MAG TPA: arginine--tRNA ligase [Candidatus Yonathbacteria bacterium]|nr:arginine--tRNA ligase [Candidatus Yonathbacteria bacterium]
MAWYAHFIKEMKEKIEAIVTEALEAIGVEAGVVHIERPADSSHGDYSTNTALVYGKKTGVSPRELAGKLVEKILESADSRLGRGLNLEIEKIEVAGAGFINFFLTSSALESALEKGPSFLKSGEKVNIEFISTNPTGELHIGHGRSAFFGDALARVLALAGKDVTREFYINDSRESNQIRELGKTALGKGEQYKTPELEEKMRAIDFTGMDEETAGVKLAHAVQESNRKFIEKGLGAHFDVWFSEDKELRASGENGKMLERLKSQNLTYEKEGALWLKTSEYGDAEDPVLVRSNGVPTYLVADIAYHQNKFDRGFKTVIDVWGADHHGHVKRMQAVGRMLGWPKTQNDADQPVVFIAQLVSLKEDGVSKKMSKRAGNVILLRDLVEEFGIDVVRWFFSDRALNTQMTFDMAIAREQSEKNPVFYTQYAHARLASIAEKCKGLKEGKETNFADLIKIPSARALASKITEFPEVVAEISRDYNVHALAGYATSLAIEANAFYRDVRVADGGTFNSSALALAIRAKETIAETLSLLGISAPERM